VAATARSERGERDAPDPIEHASPDVEIAEAQLALGRPDLSDAADADAQQAALAEEAELEEAEFEREEDEADAAAPGVLPARTRVEQGSARGVTTGEVTAPAHGPGLIARLVNFAQGSWRELQRVQWPDRRQVMQATGVVIGFVIVAGVFLGVADFVSGKLMNYILTGHFK
jgi:preprotein translocase SecE subunit